MGRTFPGDLLLHLESFRTLLVQVRRARAGAFEHAARELHVDRSVLRRRIQTLKEWFGAPLLEGRGTELRPTAAGLRLAERAERITSLVKQLPEEVARSTERIVIGCTGTITTELLPPVIVELEKRSRPVQLVVRRAGSAMCQELVRGGAIDVGVVRADEAPRGFSSAHIADDRLWFVMPKGHPLAAQAKISLAEMASVPLVLFGEASKTRARVMERLDGKGATIRVEIDGKAAALEYVRAGIGATFLSLLPGHAIDAKGVHARDVTSLFGSSRFFAIGRRERWSDPLMTDLVGRLTRRVADSRRAGSRR